MFVGRLTEEKGIRLLLADWPASERLDVIGTGPLEAEVRHLASGRLFATVVFFRTKGTTDSAALEGPRTGWSP